MDASHAYRPGGEERDGTQGQGGRVVLPTLLRDPSTFGHLATTLRTWSPFDAASFPGSPTFASPSLSPPDHLSLADRLSSHGRTQDGKHERRTDGSQESGAGQSASELGGEEEGAAEAGESGTTREREAERVVWGGWGELQGGLEDKVPRRVLLVAYASAGFAVWDCSTLESWYEILNLASLNDALGPAFAKRFPHGVGEVVSATVLPAPTPSTNCDDPYSESRPLLSILTHRDSATSSSLLLYSLQTHRIVNVLDINGIGHRVLSSKRSIIVSTSSPPALQILSALTFLPTSFSPLTDTAPSPFDGAPVFDLGKGGRLLAYATSAIIPASLHDREAARPGAGIVAQRGMFDADQHSDPLEQVSLRQGGFMGDGRSAGQVGGEVARRTAEGVLSGVKALGGMGMSYLQQRIPNSVTGSPTDAGGRNLSKSAPLPSFLGFERTSPLNTPARRSRTQNRTPGADAPFAGTVIVVDLLSFSPAPPAANSSRRKAPPSSPALKTIAHFRPSLHPIALVSLSPSSSLVLTSSSQGHAFDVFELKPTVNVGTSAKTAVSNGVWHRYRLSRGVTAAKAGTATWSPDSRFVAVATGKGTTHVYATQPFGGKPVLENHFEPKVANTQELQPLSVTLSVISRIRSANRPLDDPSSSLPPLLAFVTKADSLSSSFKPSPSPSKASPNLGRPLSPRSPSTPLPPLPSTSTTSFQDFLMFYPTRATCVLERLSSFASPATAGGTLAAASRGDVGRLANTAVSGLSHLMKSRGTTASPKSEYVVACSGKAEWAVARRPGWGEVRESLDFAGLSGVSADAGSRFSAQAEIETFSRSPLVLPRSVYQSQQFDFYALPDHHSTLAATGNYAFPLRHLEMRSEPHPTSTSLDSNLLQPLSPSCEPASFDNPIKSAMQTIIDRDDSLPRSPKAAPAFPNGLPGKHGSWRDAIPIRAPSVNDGVARVRRELGRVRASAIGPRRRATSGAYPEAASSSVSFEDDAVFADRVGCSESGSTACTSEQDVESEDTWDLDGLEEEDRAATRAEAIAEISFEDDFDDFDLGPRIDKPPSPPRLSSPSFDANLTLPVPILPEHDEVISSLDPSPQKESHLVEPVLSSSPASSSGKKSRSRKGKA